MIVNIYYFMKDREKLDYSNYNLIFYQNLFNPIKEMINEYH